MNAVTRIGAFAAGLTVVFGVAFAVGSVAGAPSSAPAAPHVTAPSDQGGHHGH